jgi:tRNA(fMet)-specific endonuclease VapC
VAVRLLLDTSAYAAMRRGDQELRRLFPRADEVLLSLIAVGEILYGLHHGSRTVANLEAFERFISQPNVRLLPVTRTTADRYARIATALRHKGRPIPTNDIWIAAQALETGADLVSADSHFDQVDGLVWIQLRT